MPTSRQAVGTVERILLLKRSRVLSGLSAEGLAVVASHARERLFAKGSVLLREGEPVTAIYLVVDGKVHVGRQGRTLGHVTGGEGAIGGLGLFARDTVGVEAVAEAETLALELDTDAVFEILEDHFPVLLHVMRVTCGDLIDLLLVNPGALAAGSPRPEKVVSAPRDLDFVDRIFLLRQADPFSRSSINALAELSRGLMEVSFDPGTVLWQVGDPARYVYMIVSGQVVCTAAGVPSVVGAGAPLGALEGIADRPRWYSAVTQTKVVALQGDTEGVVDVFEDNFEMAMDYLAVVARGLLQLIEDASASAADPLGRFFGCEALPAAERP